MKVTPLVSNDVQLLINFSELSDLALCNLQIETFEGDKILVVDCPADGIHLSREQVKEIVYRLWRERSIITASANALNFGKKVIIKARGRRFGSASSTTYYPHGVLPMDIVSASTESSYRYDDLLSVALRGESPACPGVRVPTFVTEIPKNWHWGQPIFVLLANSEVTRFSKRPSPRWHGDDVTLLYDQSEFEKQYQTLMRALEESPNKKRVLIQDYEYRSYTVDSSRQSLCRDQEMEYVSDFEIIYLDDLDMILRICYCKDRRPR